MASDVISPVSGLRRPTSAIEASAAGGGEASGEADAATPMRRPRTKEAVVMTLAGPQLVHVPVGAGGGGRAAFGGSALSALTGKKDARGGPPGGLVALLRAAMEAEESGAETPAEGEEGDAAAQARAQARALRDTFFATISGGREKEEERDEDGDHKLPRFLYNIRVAPSREEEEEDAPTPPQKSKFGARGRGGTPTNEEDGDFEELSMKAAREAASLAPAGGPGGNRKGVRPRDELVSREMVKAAERKLLAKVRREQEQGGGGAGGGHGGGAHGGHPPRPAAAHAPSLDTSSSRGSRGGGPMPSPAGSRSAR